MIRLQCYEPAGTVLELTPDDLTRHIIGLGSTGSGKTTAMINPILRQLLAWRANEPGARLGLLVLDPKGDDSIAKIQAYARDVGREADLAVLSPQGNAWYDLLGGFARLDQTHAYTRRLLSGSRDLGRDNAYWTESRNGLFETALVLLLANGPPVTFADAITFMQSWWLLPDSSQVQPKLDFVQQLLTDGALGQLTRRRLELALNEVKNWARLDPRTRELHRSTLNNALRPLLSSAAYGFFTPKPVEFRPKDVLDGKILVVSLDAISNPELARLLFRVLRRDFYVAVQSRVVVRPERDRLCGLIADELPLSVMPEDVPALSVVRAKGGFVVAAAQSLNGIDEVLGWRGREALLANFNSIFFFSSRENALDECALLTLGTRSNTRRREPFAPMRDTLVDGNAEFAVREPVCPPGTLARLKQHQAFVKLADGTCPPCSVWLQPNFFDVQPSTQIASTDDLSEAVARLRKTERARLDQDPGVPSFLLHMHRSGHPLMLTPAIVAAVWQFCVPKISKHQLAAQFGRSIQGLEVLPACWIAGLYCWTLRNPSLAALIEGLGLKSGILWPKLTPATTHWGDGSVTIPESLNLFVYPSLWRPLLLRHRAQLLSERPDLREEIMTLPALADIKT